MIHLSIVCRDSESLIIPFRDLNSEEAYPQIVGFNETINSNNSLDVTTFETIPETKAISEQLAVEDAELEEEINLLDFDPMSMISNLGKYATLLEKKKTVIETSDHDCGNTHFFLGNGKNLEIYEGLPYISIIRKSLL